MMKSMIDYLLINIVLPWNLQVYWRWFWYIYFTHKEASCVGRWTRIVHCITCFAVSLSSFWESEFICNHLLYTVNVNIGGPFSRMPITVYMYDKEAGGLISIAEYGQEYGKENPIRVLYHGFGHYDALDIPTRKGPKPRL